MTEDGPTAASRGLASCHTCNKLVDARKAPARAVAPRYINVKATACSAHLRC